MPILDKRSISRFTPEQALHEILSGNFGGWEDDLNSDTRWYELVDGSRWGVTSAELRKRDTHVVQIETHTLTPTGWVQGHRDHIITAAAEKEQVIHVMHLGSPLCRFSSEPPHRWPEGHYWAPFSDDGTELPRDATCLRCFELAQKLWCERKGATIDLAITDCAGAVQICVHCGKEMTLHKSSQTWHCVYCGHVQPSP